MFQYENKFATVDGIFDFFRAERLEHAVGQVVTEILADHVDGYHDTGERDLQIQSVY